MKKYKNIFFDLDNTLWDFKVNSEESLKELYEKYDFDEDFESFDEFYEQYEQINEELWKSYRLGEITKDTLGVLRFNFAAEKKNNPSISALNLNNEYLALTTQKTKIIDDAIEVLKYLKNKYFVHIITDGFFEVQLIKIRNSKLAPYINDIIIAEEAGVLKPNKELFDYALAKTGAEASTSLMIGDNFDTDIVGAKNAGLDQMFFNRQKKNNLPFEPTFIIYDLKEIMQIL